jgi:8-oxo-dGTP diphosphatase
MRYAFCPRCATPLGERTIDEEMYQVCPACGYINWEHPAPTSSGLLVRGGQVLLVRRAVEPMKGAWDVPGGFMRRGEHPADAVRREFREELGVEIRRVEFLDVFLDVYGKGGQPTLNLYYIVEGDASTVHPADDVSEAAWFPLNRLPEPLAFENNHRALAALLTRLHG